MHGVASTALSPTLPQPQPQPQPLLGSLSAGEPGAEQPRHGEHRVGVGRGQRERYSKGDGEVEAGGSFRQRAGHCWAVAAGPEAVTAETAGATRNKHANDT